MKKVISIIFLFPLCCVGQNNLQQTIGDCDVYINSDTILTKNPSLVFVLKGPILLTIVSLFISILIF